MLLTSEQYACLRPYPPKYPIYPRYSDVAQYLEHFFFNYYRGRVDAFSRCNRQFIPVYWTTVYNDGANSAEVYNVLQSLDRAGKYFTVNQHDNGVQFPLPPDTLVFSASEAGEGRIIPIPLVTSTLPDVPLNLPAKDILCSFVGTLTHTVRVKLYEELSNKPGFYFCQPKNWSAHITSEQFNEFKEITLRSKYCLAPRGNIIQSFRIYEILQLNSVPVIVSDSFTFPFGSFVAWNEFAVIISDRDIAALPSILHRIPDDIYEKLLRRGKEVYSKYFTLQGVSSTIAEILCN